MDATGNVIGHPGGGNVAPTPPYFANPGGGAYSFEHNIIIVSYVFYQI
jgi:hypothetical protein